MRVTLNPPQSPAALGCLSPPELPAEIIHTEIIPQLAPPVHGYRTPWGHSLEQPGELASTGEVDASIAAAVAAIAPGHPVERATERPAPAAPRIPRAGVVRMPSEQWLKKTCADLDTLPEQTRAAAFAKIMQRFHQLQEEERAWGRQH